MSNSILVIGESGSGKSTSIRNLNHEETFLINVLDKSLPFRGYKNKYFKESTKDKKANYMATDNCALIEKVLQKINNDRPEIKNVIIDDFQYLMANEFMRRAKERGFDKFTEIAQHAWSVINATVSLRSDITCFILSHSDTDMNGKVKPKTIGRMLDEKITIEGMFTTVLHSKIIDGQYKFLTQNDGIHVAKSPMELFEDKLIDNDLQFVKQKFEDYYNQDINM